MSHASVIQIILCKSGGKNLMLAQKSGIWNKFEQWTLIILLPPQGVLTENGRKVLIFQQEK